MISFLKGELVEFTPEHIVLDVGGVGYCAMIPSGSFEEYSGEYPIGCTMKIFTHLYVREDEVSLYGFLSIAEREMFRYLIGASGVGPKTALGMLSVYSPEQIYNAVLLDDVKMLSKAPGIGAKTAQKMILELKDKFLKTDVFSSFVPENYGKAGSAGAASGDDDMFMTENGDDAVSDTILALESLGYKHADAVRAVRRVRASLGEGEEGLMKDSSRLLRKALMAMS